MISIRDFVFRCLRIIVVSALFWSPPCRRRVFSLETLRHSLQPCKFLIVTIYKPFNSKNKLIQSSTLLYISSEIEIIPNKHVRLSETFLF